MKCKISDRKPPEIILNQNPQKNSEKFSPKVSNFFKICCTKRHKKLHFGFITKTQEDFRESTDNKHRFGFALTQS